MFTQKVLLSSFSRTAVLAIVAGVVAVLTLTAVEPSVAMVGTTAPAKGVSMAQGIDQETSTATDISAARRRHHARGSAAVRAAFASIVGGHSGYGYGYGDNSRNMHW